MLLTPKRLCHDFGDRPCDPQNTQAGLEERRELVQQIEALQGALQQAQAGGGSSGLGSPKSSNSVAGVSVPGARGLPHVSPNRPYRTGLTSKPKFK